MKVMSKDNIRKLITIEDSIKCVEDAFVKYSAKEVVMPQRHDIYFKENNGNMLFMPAYINGSKYLGSKVV